MAHANGDKPAHLADKNNGYRPKTADAPRQGVPASGGSPSDGAAGGDKPTKSKGPRRRHRALVVVVLLVCLVAAGVACYGLWGPSTSGLSDVFGGQASGGSGADEPTISDETESGGGSGTAETGAGTGTQEAQAEPVQIRLVMAGDILKHMYLVSSGDNGDGTYNFDHIYAHVTDELSGFDIRVVNQETPAAGTALGLSGYPSFNAPLEFNDATAKAGFNVILKASNHSMDAGYDGIHSELAYWSENYPDVHPIGIVDRDVDTETSPYKPYVYEKDGFKVALLNFTYDLNGYEDPENSVALLDWDHEDSVRAAIQEAKSEADMVVVFPHWGTEYELEPTDEQRAWADVFCEEGVDVIIGDHPHVIEPVEVLTRPDGGQTLCYWSVGNFVSNQNDNSNLVGGLAEVTLNKAADGTCSVGDYAFVPVVCHKGSGSDFTTYLLSDYNDELASTNVGPYTSNTSCTVAWVNDFCSDVLGDAYDPSAERLTGTVQASTEAAAEGTSGQDVSSETEELQEAA